MWHTEVNYYPDQTTDIIVKPISSEAFLPAGQMFGHNLYDVQGASDNELGVHYATLNFTPINNVDNSPITMYAGRRSHLNGQKCDGTDLYRPLSDWPMYGWNKSASKWYNSSFRFLHIYAYDFLYTLGYRVEIREPAFGYYVPIIGSTLLPDEGTIISTSVLNAICFHESNGRIAFDNIRIWLYKRTSDTLIVDIMLIDQNGIVIKSYTQELNTSGLYFDFLVDDLGLDIDNNCYTIQIKNKLVDVRLFSPAYTGNCCSTTSYENECYGAQEVPFSEVISSPSVRGNLYVAYVVTGSDNDANDDDKCLFKLYVRRNGVETLLYQKETFDLSANRVQESATVTYTPDKNDTSFIVRWEGRHGGAGSSCIGVDQIEILTPSYYYPVSTNELEIYNETIINDCNCKNNT